MTLLFTDTGDYILERDVKDKTVLDIGCYKGYTSLYCSMKGAKSVTGIDAWPRSFMLKLADSVAINLQEGQHDININYINIDVLSDRFLGLGQFDVVICAGVLYHVNNVVSFLDRVRNVTRERLFLETAVTKKYGDSPVMELAGPDFDPSCWWIPTTACLLELLETAGFTDIEILEGHGDDPHKDTERVVLTAVPGEKNYSKLTPTSNTNTS